MSSRQRWTLVLVCTAAFMLLLDITVVSVALPSIQRDLHASLPDLQWVSAGVCTGAGRAAAAGGHPGRPAGPAPPVSGRPGHLHRRVAGLCAGNDRAAARAVPRAAGSRRRGAVRHRHAAAARRVLRRRPGPGARRLRRHARRRQRHRAAGRRGADRHTRLAGHLLRQPAHRRGGVRGRGGPAARIPRSSRRPGRLGGHGPDHRGVDRARCSG